VARQLERRVEAARIIGLRSLCDELIAGLEEELDYHHEALVATRLRERRASDKGIAVPQVYTAVSTGRVLVMEEVEAKTIADEKAVETCPVARHDLAMNVLSSFIGQVLDDGFFHADPHPGNMMWSGGKVYLLDLGMVGEVDGELRRSLLLLLLAFWREDVGFLADLMVSLSAEPVSARFERDAFRSELTELVSRYRHLPLNELRLGPLLQQLTEMSLRHGIRLPAALALIGKAFGQMQLAAAELDPSLDPFSAAGAFYMRQLGDRVRTSADPRQVFFEAQKLRVRADRLLESLERVVGARPGIGLQVEMTRNAELTAAIERTGKRIALGLGAAGAAVLGAVVLSEARRARR
jgi:predicted unusual protein kinase regulating ubiquinone biosynthesis (AarF/ABC1/UbiB family)